MVLKAIELIDSGKVQNKTYFDIAMDLRSVVYSNYVHYNESKVHPIGTYGRYFKEVIANPIKYI